MTGQVEGKVALVTGGALGIGASACRLLAREGARVAVTDVRDEDGRRLAAGLGPAPRAGYWHLDVSNEDNVRSVFAEVADALGPVTVLVNNAGIAGVNKPTDQITEAEWDALMAVNVKGVFFCTKHVIAQMRRAGGGSIINLSSIYGLVGAPDSPPYHASKGAVRLMSKTDALLYAPDRIRVNSLHPGFIVTPMVDGFLEMSGHGAELRRALEALHPLGHLGDPDDVGYAIVYLASDEAKFVTGSELVVDGGYTAR
jgi:NAD(P)-dependent dehydrogenase (short-subunit alcohol dehydrogenase family)